MYSLCLFYLIQSMIHFGDKEVGYVRLPGLDNWKDGGIT